MSGLLRWVGLAIVSMLVVVGLSLPLHRSFGVAEAAMVVQTPLSTRGAEIVDRQGQPILLRGVNWFGIETDTHAPHGLWARDYRDMLAQMKDLGYNLIRLPFSIASLRSDTVSGIDFSVGHNRDLEGKTPLEVMDRIIQEAERQGLMVLLDSHRLNDQRISELWYGDGFTEADWIDTWLDLAERYRHQANVIGADLKNEPHGSASWGTGDRATDWRLAAERAGNAILKVNPDWLIVVEGVQNNVPDQRLTNHWQGGNLEGVRNAPVRLSQLNKLVYSPHEYGPGVYEQSWFSERSFPNNLYRRWEIGFNYIATLKLAPVLIGEFGGRRAGSWSREGVWQRQFVEYIKENQLSFAYWSWNPNSNDTGGILNDDWRTVNERKQDLLGSTLDSSRIGLTATTSPPLTVASAVLRARSPAADPIPAAAPSALPSPLPAAPVASDPAPSPAPSPDAAPLLVKSTIQSDWQTGFCAGFQVSNPGGAIAQDWRVTFQMNQAEINNSWNGTFDRQGSQYTIHPPDWATKLSPGQTVDIGFCAQKQGGDYQPGQVVVASGPTISAALPPSQPIVNRPLQANLQVESQIQSDWADGFCVAVQVKNRGSVSSQDWQLAFVMDDADIDNSWNGSFTRQGSHYTVKPLDWARSIQPSQSLDLGFCAKKKGATYQPHGFEVL